MGVLHCHCHICLLGLGWELLEMGWMQATSSSANSSAVSSLPGVSTPELSISQPLGMGLLTPSQENKHQGVASRSEAAHRTHGSQQSAHTHCPKWLQAPLLTAAFTFLQESSVFRGPGVLSHPLNFSDDSLSRFWMLCSK